MSARSWASADRRAAAGFFLVAMVVPRDWTSAAGPQSGILQKSFAE
jgi:hypothetical protein